MTTEKETRMRWNMATALGKFTLITFLILQSAFVEIKCNGVEQCCSCPDFENNNDGNFSMPQCSCQDMDGQCHVNCVNLKLGEFPGNLPNCTNVLNLTDANVTRLEVMDISNFMLLHTLVLTGNPLNCDCDLQWLNIFILKKRLHVIDAFCASPDGLAEKPVGELEHDFNCPDFLWRGNDLFYIGNEDNVTWRGANDSCNDFGVQVGLTSHLATVTDDLQIFRNYTTYNKTYWIGCSDSYNENTSINEVNISSNQNYSGELYNAGNDTPCCHLRASNGQSRHLTIGNGRCQEQGYPICKIGDAIHPYPTEGTVVSLSTTTLLSSENTKIETTSAYKHSDTSNNKEATTTSSYSDISTNGYFLSTNENVSGQPDDYSTYMSSSVTQTPTPISLTSTFPPEKAGQVSEMLRNITANASNLQEDDVNQYVHDLDKILTSQKNGTELPVATSVLHTVDNLLSVSDEVLMASQSNQNAATRLLQIVERLSLLLEFDNESVTIETSNIVLTAASINASEFGGLSFAVSSTGQNKLSKESDGSTENVASSIQLPVSLFDNVNQSQQSQVRRAQFIVYKSNSIFKAVDNSTPAGFSPVIAASIGKLKINNLREPVKIALAHQKSHSINNNSCVFWDYNLNGGSGAWSHQGCAVSRNTENNDDTTTVCECDHLTNFALLVDVYGDVQELDVTNQKSLSIISYIGCVISLLSLAATLVSLLVYRRKKDKATKILQNLCFALFMALLMFLIGSFAIDFAPIVPELCITVAVLLHYFLLAVMLWMALEALQLYLMLVKVFQTYITHFMVKFCLVGWGLPLVIVIITVAVNVDNYGYHNTICWLSRYPFYGAFLAPLCLVLIFNTIVYCLVIYQICGLNSKAMTANERFSAMAQLRAAFGMMVLLGLTWVFAIFAIGEASLLFSYLFAIFNSLQGLFIFIFHCALKKEIKEGWKKTFCRCKGIKHRTGYTDTWTSSSNGLKYDVSKTAETDLQLDLSTALEGHTYHDNDQAISTFKEFSTETEN